MSHRVIFTETGEKRIKDISFATLENFPGSLVIKGTNPNGFYELVYVLESKTLVKEDINNE
jgi:hypothetical protein